MSFVPNNFISYLHDNPQFANFEFSTSGSPFRSSDDNDTKSETPFGLSTHSSGNYYSTPYNTEFDYNALINPPKKKPFKIIRTTLKEREEMIKLSAKSKKIQKRYIAKERTEAKQEVAALLLTAPQKYIPAAINDPKLDDKSKRRLIQKVKNRIASQHTRDQRKKYISELEEIKMHLEKANRELNEKNRLLSEKTNMLEERLKTVEHRNIILSEENNELRRRDIPNFLPGFETKIEESSNIDFRIEGFDEGDEEAEMLSPTLNRKQTKSSNHYWTFFLGIFTVCVVCSGIAVKLGQGSSHGSAPSKGTTESKGNEGVKDVPKTPGGGTVPTDPSNGGQTYKFSIRNYPPILVYILILFSFIVFI